MSTPTLLTDLEAIKARGLSKLTPPNARISIGMGTCGIGNGADLVHTALEKAVEKTSSKGGADPTIVPVGCLGYCAAEPLVVLSVPGKPALLFTKVSPKDATALVEAARDSKALEKIAKKAAEIGRAHV